MMVGRSVQLRVDKEPAQPGEPVLELQDVVVYDDRGQVVVNDVSLEVRAGEIVCIAGVQGNGQTELVEVLVGLRPVSSGTVWVGHRDVTRDSVHRVLHSGVGLVPEDRVRDGLILEFSIADNLVLDSYDLEPFARWVIRDDQSIGEAAERRVKEFDIRTPSVTQSVATLSGGNQQKVIVAREFSRPIHLLVASQPTRGLDVGSIEYIHKELVEKRDQGLAILIVSSELDEVLALADRIAVMYRGQVVAELPAERATREGLGLLMAGVRDDQAAAGE